MKGGHRKFRRDLGQVAKRLVTDLSGDQAKSLLSLKRRLVRLNRDGLVKVNHSVMELICAKYLIVRGYRVEVERPLDDVLICDLYGVKGDGSLIIEVETGFTPPEHALDPYTYNMARIASKVARYSRYSDKFGLATPAYNILRIPEVLVKPVRARSDEEVRELKALCDRYYRNPPITEDEIMKARLHMVLILDIDGCKAVEVDPEGYMEQIRSLGYLRIILARP